VLTFDLRLQPTLQLCLEPTSNSHRYPSSGSPSNRHLPTDLGLASAFSLPATAFQLPPSRRPSTCVSGRPSSSAFQLPPNLIGDSSSGSALQLCFDLRLRSTFQPHLPANLLTCVSSQPSSSAIRPVFSLRLWTRLPALPFNRLSDSHRQLVVPALPSNRPRTCVSV